MLKTIRILLLQTSIVLAMLVGGSSVQADEPFVGEVRWFAGNFAPRGWAFCNGQLLPIPQNIALFSLLGTTYGGDGETTFGLPDLRGSVMVHQGPGPGLASRTLGERGGNENVTLAPNQVANHSHELRAAINGDNIKPDDRALANTGRLPLFRVADNPTFMDSASIAPTGGGEAHNEMQPFVSLNCIIATEGLYPSE